MRRAWKQIASTGRRVGGKMDAGGNAEAIARSAACCRKGQATAGPQYKVKIPLTPDVMSEWRKRPSVSGDWLPER